MCRHPTLRVYISCIKSAYPDKCNCLYGHDSAGNDASFYLSLCKIGVCGKCRQEYTILNGTYWFSQKKIDIPSYQMAGLIS